MRRWRHRSTPGTATRPRSCSRPSSARRARRVTWPQGLDAHRPGRAVDVAVRPGAHRRQLPDCHPRPGAGRPRLRAERPGTFRRRRVGRQPGDARGGLRHLELAAKLASGAPSLSVGTRPDVHAWPWRRMPTGCLATTTMPCRAVTTPSSWPGRSITRTAWRWRWPTAAITHQMRHDLPGLRDTVGELRELCDRYGFAYYREWGLILDGWSRPGGSGIDLARLGIGNLKSAGRVRAHAVLAVAARRPAGPP